LKLKLHVGLRVAIALAQLLLHNKNRSHIVHTEDRSSGDSSIASYQQAFTLSQIPEAHWNQDIPLQVI